uniref:Uncharacterized protein n=1 Tax=candidate division CPR3 bacterium TaxID=2268181 RepID=A0A7C5Z3N5_UNCC3
MKKIGSILKGKKFEKNTKIAYEFQVYGCYLAESLNDTKKVGLYINLAKRVPRSILENAYQFAVDYPNVKKRARIFMWKLKQLGGFEYIKKRKTN